MKSYYTRIDMRRLPLIILLSLVIGLWSLVNAPAVRADWFSDLLHFLGLTQAAPQMHEEVIPAGMPPDYKVIPPVAQAPAAQLQPAQSGQVSTQATSGTANADEATLMQLSADTETALARVAPPQEVPVRNDMGSFFEQLLQSIGLLPIVDNSEKTADDWVKSGRPPGVDDSRTDVPDLATALDRVRCGKFLPPGVGCTEDNTLVELVPPPSATPTPSPSPTPTSTPAVQPTGGVPLAQCLITSDTANACYWRKFLPYFNNDENEAKIASKICSLESGGGNTFALNDRCLESKYPDPTKRTRDYSVGLFQINLLAHQKDHCPGVLIDNWNTRDPLDNTLMRSCSIVSGKEAELSACVNKLYDPDYNIRAMRKIYDSRIAYSGWDTRWNPWATYTQIVSKCKVLSENIPSGGSPDPFPANCPDPASRIAVPNTQYMKLDQSLGCMRPTMIVIHWSAAWTTAEATFNTLNKYKTDAKTGQTYRNGCQFATDENHQLQLQDFWNDQVIWGYCVGGAENAISINDEITGSYFDRLFDQYGEIIDSTYGRRLALETNRSLATTCWAMKQYNIPISRVIGHIESPWGQTSGKIDPSIKYMEYYRRRLSQECR